MVTKPLNSRSFDDSAESVSPARSALSADSASVASTPRNGRAHAAWKVAFHLASPHSSSIGLDVWRTTVLGRADPKSAFRPDLDYGPFGGLRYGVSRRHALVRPHQDALYIVDQNSTNGTWVNGQRLVPGEGVPLADGDMVELGALSMTVRIERPPAGNGTANNG